MGFRKIFRWIANTSILELLTFEIGCWERSHTLWEKYYSSVRGELEMHVICPLYCLDIEEYKPLKVLDLRK